MQALFHNLELTIKWTRTNTWKIESWQIILCRFSFLGKKSPDIFFSLSYKYFLRLTRKPSSALEICVLTVLTDILSLSEISI